jgi:hypothetical protein
MPEACPYSNCVVAFPLRVLRVPSWTKDAGQESGATPRPWGVTAYAVTQTERGVCSCCYFLWKKVTKELAESERTLQSLPRVP